MLDTGETQETLLEVNNIEVIYNHVILVLKGVSLSVPKGGITALLGGNGAGKSTTLKAISNLLRSERGDVTKGTIEYRGESITDLNPAALVKRGVIQVMEGRHCFEHLTVEDNLMTGAYTRKDGKGAVAADLEMVYDYFPRLRERRKSQAGYTSGGEQQMIAIGRALMSKPETVLLDEPSMGLAPQLVEEIFEIAEGRYKYKEPPEIKGTGYVVKSLEAALWAFCHSTSFKDGCLLAVNLGDDADTTGAVYGHLAGAFYGVNDIPGDWPQKIAHTNNISRYRYLYHHYERECGPRCYHAG